MTAIVVAASLAAGCVSFTTGSKAVNPYMPMWEHIPDGEPYVFEDPDNPGTRAKTSRTTPVETR